MTRRSFVHYNKGAKRPGLGGGASGRYCDAVDIETAAHAINHINARKKREDYEQRHAERTKVTLGGADLAAWLRKETP